MVDCISRRSHHNLSSIEVLLHLNDFSAQHATKYELECVFLDGVFKKYIRLSIIANHLIGYKIIKQNKC